MDDAPAVVIELDTFSLILPLPFRVGLIIVLGVWAWGLNVHYLRAIKIDVASLIHYPSRASPSQSALHHSTYRFATILTIPLITTLLLFWLITHGSTSNVISWSILPNLNLFIIILLFILPLRNTLSTTGRYRTLAILKRILIGGLAQPTEGKFGDVLLADVLTSYAKVMGDLFVALCMFITRGTSSTDRPDRRCGGPWLVPLVIAAPSVIRIRQCLIEYSRVRRGEAGPGAGWGGQHLANAIKYSSAFPVIILSALLRDFDEDRYGVSESTLFRMWLLAVFGNSLYSFYWDVAKDWDLSLFSNSRVRNDPEYPYGLRKRRFFQNHEIYYSVIAMDLLLRCTWSFKLSPHLDHFNDLEGGIFMMELLEVFRRWVWIFLRIETEWVRNHKPPINGPILLTDFNASNKIGDESDED